MVRTDTSADAARAGTASATGVLGWTRGELAILLLVTIGAVALRLWRVEVWSVSAAEAAMWRDATAVGEAAGASRWSLLAVLLRVLFDGGVLPMHGEGWLRLPFLFLSTLTVPLLALAVDVFAARRIGLLAAAILAVHPWHIEVSQTASGHGPAMTFAMLGVASIAAARYQIDDARWLNGFGAGALVVAGWCHPLGWLAVAVLGFGLVLRRGGIGRVQGRVFAGAMALGVIVVTFAVRWFAGPAENGDVVALGPVLVEQVAALGLPVALAVVLASRLPWPPAGSIAGVGVDAGVVRHLLVASAAALGAPALLGAVAVTPCREHALLLLPIAAIVAAAVGLQFWDRLWSPGSGSRGSRLGRFLGSLSITRLAIPGLVILLIAGELLVSTFLYATAQRGSRPDWRGARDLVVERTSEPWFTVLAGAGRDSLVYYLRPDEWRGRRRDPHPGIVVERLDPAAAADTLGAQVTAAEAAWLTGGERPHELFVLLLRDEHARIATRAATDPAAALLANRFQLTDVLACAGPQRDESIYVYRWQPPE